MVAGLHIRQIGVGVVCVEREAVFAQDRPDEVADNG
jgi:hypothetical protein